MSQGNISLKIYGVEFKIIPILYQLKLFAPTLHNR